jgi:dienelactone hydrolase
MTPSRNLVAYVAGPYRDARGAHYVGDNITRARRVAADLWARGYAVLCPHLNTAHMGGLCDDTAFLDGAIELMRRCDLVVLTPDWYQSSGAQAEVREAFGYGIPVYKWPLMDALTTQHFNAVTGLALRGMLPSRGLSK